MTQTQRSAGLRRGTARGATALSCLLILTSAAVTAHTKARESIRSSNFLGLATEACEEQLEHWRDAGYGRLPLIPEGVCAVSWGFGPLEELPGARALMVLSRVNDGLLVSREESGRRRLDARVIWVEDGTSRQVNLATFLLRDR